MLEDVEGQGVRGVEDEGQAHVGGGVVEIAQQVHGLRAPFGPKLSVQLQGSSVLIG